MRFAIYGTMCLLVAGGALAGGWIRRVCCQPADLQMPLPETKASVPSIDEQLNTLPWLEIGGASAIDATEFQIGDLVPCPDAAAQLYLIIRAMRQDACLYERRQAFRLYDGSGPNPADEHGMSSGYLVCGALPGGFASGSYQYLDLLNDRVVVQVDWKISREKVASQEFAAKLTAVCGQSGSVDAGNGNTLKWTFASVPPKFKVAKPVALPAFVFGGENHAFEAALIQLCQSGDSANHLLEELRRTKAPLWETMEDDAMGHIGVRISITRSAHIYYDAKTGRLIKWVLNNTFL